MQRDTFSTQPEQKVFWTEIEWLLSASMLIDCNPQHDFLSAQAATNGYPGLTVRMFNEAVGKALPPDRHRRFVALTTVRPKLDEAMATLRGGMDETTDHHQYEHVFEQIESLGLLKPPEILPVAETAPEIPPPQEAQQEAAAAPEPPIETPPEPEPLHEPPPRASDQYNPLATAMHDAFNKQSQRVFWKKHEYTLLAEEIHRQNPFAGWPYKEHLAGLTSDEIRAAQIVLPQDRRRKITTLVGLRENLIEAFKPIRARLDEEKRIVQQIAEREQQVLEQAEAQRILANQRIAELEQQAVLTTPAPVVQMAAPSGDLMTQIAQAMTPLFQLLAKEIGKELKPIIEDVVLELLTTPTPVTPCAPVASAINPADIPKPTSAPIQLQPEDDPEDDPEPEPQPRPPKIAVIGPMGRQQRDLEDEFPYIDFIWLERTPKGVKEALESCVKMIGVEGFVNDATKHIIRDHGKEKFLKLHGSVSIIKRQINMWIHEGVVRAPHQKSGIAN